jgi:hypothetical protein
MIRGEEMHNGYGRQAGSSGAHSVARGLGWFSIALGLAEVAAPRTLTRALGMEGEEALVRAYGLREIATGAAILAADNPQPWVWGRVAGDALDMATLGASYRDGNAKSQNLSLALAAVAGVTALDVWCAQALGNGAGQRSLPARDYRDRSGFPRPPAEMRGAARDRVNIPSDMRGPEAMRPYDAV